ncbi:MAG: hypothetical protein MZV63_10220 [Marinilabiliales bacterium]|nr:hypothetical protein [Marinilabiliales bacterium]
MADWSVNASQEINGKSDARLGLALGAMVAGGEATANYITTARINLTKNNKVIFGGTSITISEQSDR